ncbi:MAG TPA: SDR family NAD(P)-dependent oxidoreductase [Candidatus Krumholzibacteria bacterium]|nr:SDR family NAD(P)-dependent oxidoreductase [Candidatus Krumholzibacteria bacterium]HRX51434.1 SDR family NAD(P)-dependent oxidoreductase [Candidatus Krumholzibacteria bacterium]
MSNGTRFAAVTGTSDGIGLALARALLDDGWRVLGCARRDAPLDHPAYRHVRVDLADPAALAARFLPPLDEELARPGLTRAALVNNAAVIGALRRVRDHDPAALVRVMALNAAAPLALMGRMVARRPEGAALRIVNVSSGAAHKALTGSADYCASKAALLLGGRTLAAELEQDGVPPRDVALLSYEPGLVATDMQLLARNAPADAFPGQPVFQSFADRGLLHPPAAVVGEMAAFLDSDPDAHFTERRFGG